MLILLPVVLLTLAAAVIFIVQRIRPSFGYAWLVATGACLLAWIALIVLRWRYPIALILPGWLPVEGLSNALLFQLDSFSWPYAFSLSSLVLAIILTAGARLRYQSNPDAWAGSMAIGGVSVLATMAINPLGLILSWTAIDLIELGVLLFNIHERRLGRGAVIAFSVRVVGTMLIVGGMLRSRSLGVPLVLTEIRPEVGLYLLLAVGLRLGVLPLHVPYAQEVPIRRGLGTMLRLAAPAASLVLLARLPAQSIPAEWSTPLLALTALAVLYGAAMWLVETDELRGRPYWLVALSGLAIGCVIQGQPVASLAWGVAMLLCGSVLFLYSASQPRLPWTPLLAMVGLTGLPFTPAADGWRGLLLPPYDGMDVAFILAAACLLGGYFRQLVRPRDAMAGLEGWAQLVYVLGLVVLVLGQWLIGAFGWQGSFGPGLWYLSPLPLLLVALGWAGTHFWGGPFNRSTSWLVALGRRVGEILAVILRLDWMYAFLGVCYRLIQRLVGFFTVILEGDGGVLWTLLLLALLISLLQSGGQP